MSCCYQLTPSVDAFFDDKLLNPFVGAGALGMIVDDWNGDAFDHSKLGFLHGGYIAGYMTTGRSIETGLVPEGTPKWGAKWKRAFVRNYLTSMSIGLMGAVMPRRENYLDLDPTYRDVYGRPLMRITFDFRDNELKMQDFALKKMEAIAQAMKPREFHKKARGPHYDIEPYQSTHNTGGAIMGANPRDSVLNRYLQHWDVSTCSSSVLTLFRKQRLQLDGHDAIRAYLRTLPAVRARQPENELPWPFNHRGLIAIWNLMKSLPGDSNNRVGGDAGHPAGEAIYVDMCSACHQGDGGGVPKTEATKRAQYPRVM